MNLSELTDKELAVLLAERLGEGSRISGDFFALPCNCESYEDYLSDKASQILFSEGMAARIGDYLWEKYEKDDGALHGYRATAKVCEWFRAITPRKIIEVFISMEDS